MPAPAFTLVNTFDGHEESKMKSLDQERKKESVIKIVSIILSLPRKLFHCHSDCQLYK